MANRLRGAVSLAVAMMVFLSCAAVRPVAKAKPNSTSAAPSIAPLRRAVRQPAPLQWTPCDGAVECATLVVPLSYEGPTDRMVSVALRRHPAENPAARIGSLVINPGGPGEAGTKLLRRDLGVLTPVVRARFDVVEMDPRGVNSSVGFTCDPPPTGPVDPIPTTVNAETAFLHAVRDYAQACATAAGPILAHMGTVDVARDLDQVRRALGDERLTFLGFSYGTLLGATYAELYPDHVRAMVLDGALDPASSTAELSLEQAEGMQAQLDGFFAWCFSTDCAWRPDGDGRAAFDALAQRLRDTPLPTSDGSDVGVSELYSATLSRMYSPTRWSSLAAALGAAERGDGQPIRALARNYFGTTPESTISPDASIAVNCLDHPVTPGLAATRDAAAAARATAPQFGPYLAWGSLQCSEWPARPTRTPHAIHASGAPPIVVVGTTHDPATPYQWAQRLQQQLDSGVLLTRTGAGHVAYLANSCVRSRLDAYFVDLAPPVTNPACGG